MRRTILIGIFVAVGIALVGGVWWWLSKEEKKMIFLTAPVKRGGLTATISATGTVEPEEVVDVGAQVAGMIRSFGQDKNRKPINYGSAVDEGTILAKIDDSLYAAAVETAKAQLQQAAANKLSAEANVLQMKAKLLQARQDWERAQRLGPSDALAQSSYDQFRSNYEVAQANLSAAEAAVEQAKAAQAQSRANLNSALSNYGYTTIKSPVKGVIIDRRVNIGQTVVASLSAPSLFLIAKDLKRVAVWVAVNEADIGSIRVGQPVTFTVDAFPHREFHGEVGKIRLNATMTQNVVTYTVEVTTDNKDGVLLPYLTANVRFNIGRRHGVLLVPNAALRWTPQSDQIDPEFRRNHKDQSGHLKDRKSPEAAAGLKKKGTLWLAGEEYVRPLPVKIDLTDGSWTEVEGQDVTEGMPVVIGETSPEEAAGRERSPFIPKVKKKKVLSQVGSGGSH